MEEAAKMIKFLCDSCGKDISEKVYDSVKQFCRRDHFEENIMPGATEDHGRQLPDVQHGIKDQREPVYIEVRLLNELTKLIHASAWGMAMTAMRCSSCAIENAKRKKGKAITIFTRIAEERLLNEMPEVAFSQ
jgi:transposase-like protein